jgi:hypothetical protein
MAEGRTPVGGASNRYRAAQGRRPGTHDRGPARQAGGASGAHSKAAAGQIQELAESELFVAGVVAYWAEGAKSKPWTASQRVMFINSDPGMVRLFLAWLQLLDIGLERCSFRVSIHESADVQASMAHWASVVGVPASQFSSPTLKRHNPRTVRKNVGIDYHGCLTVTVRRSTELGRQIAGWFEGIVTVLPDPQHLLSRVNIEAPDA